MAVSHLRDCSSACLADFAIKFAVALPAFAKNMMYDNLKSVQVDSDKDFAHLTKQKSSSHPFMCFNMLVFEC